MQVFPIALVVARDLKRLQQIVTVLLRFGFGDLVRRLGLHRLLKQAGLAPGETGAAVPIQDTPARLRLAIEALGPTFVKLGQILATRSDLLPPEWIAELEKLHDRVPPLPYEAVAPLVEAALGSPPDAVFARFDREPLASASIAQVHRAALADGTEVVVKIRRPGLRPLVEADLRLLALAAKLAEEELPELRRYHPEAITRHLAAAIGEELDLANEGRNAELIAAQFEGQPAVVVPRIHWAWSSGEILVQDFVAGVRPSDEAALEAAGLDRRRLAARSAGAFLQMMLIDGVFHADPHPGNMLCLPGDRIAYLDFGTIGRLSARRRDQLVTLMAAITGGSAAGVREVLLDWAGQPDIDARPLEEAAEAFLARHTRGALGRLKLGQALAEFVALMRDHDLALPPDLALVLKALMTSEGVVRRLDPELDVVREVEPVVRRALAARYAPEALLNRAGSALLELQALADDAPGILRRVLRRLEKGRVRLEVEIGRMDRFGRSIERGAARIAVAIVTAAFVVGLAPILAETGPRLFGIPFFALLGCLAALAGIAWLLLPGRKRD
ncbi:ubiquinone biosynthesis protein UbiB [Inquilinus limosus]|uniref:ABC1 kinase family protein n=1 Tax=Inquilinus limosus TaxID=171674 RepID=UPI003F18F852